MKKIETIYIDGIEFYRNPDAKHAQSRNYYTIRKHVKAGLGLKTNNYCLHHRYQKVKESFYV